MNNLTTVTRHDGERFTTEIRYAGVAFFAKSRVSAVDAFRKAMHLANRLKVTTLVGGA